MILEHSPLYETDKKITIFTESLENIEINTLNSLIEKISKNLPLDVLKEKEEIKYEQGIESISSIDESTNIYFPLYIDGSFKEAINMFFNKNQSMQKLYEMVLKEIQKIYRSYIKIENKLYEKINILIKFDDEESKTKLEIMSKMKEIFEILAEVKKFLIYLNKNLKNLKQIFENIDIKLSEIYEVKSISLYFLLNIFDLPNNELSYILMFKIVDETSCILNQISKSFFKEINDDEKTEKALIINEESNLIDEENSEDTLNAMINLAKQYKIKINNLLYFIDSYELFRVKYQNKFLYTRGNFNVDNNNYDNEDCLPINTLMDEEVIIKKFINKKVITEFLKDYKKKLRNSFKRDEKIIIWHSIFFNMISILILFGYSNLKYGLIDISVFNFAKIISKAIFNKLLAKNIKMKTNLILSNLLLIIGLLVAILKNEENNFDNIMCLSRFIIGLSYGKNIESRFLLNYSPKLLMIKAAKKYYFIKYLSLFFGFFFFAIFYVTLNNVFNEEDRKIIYKIEILFLILSIIFFLIICFSFKEPKYENLLKSKNKKNYGRINLQEKSEAKSILSYGKSKSIKFKDKNKAKSLEESLKVYTDNKNYEGTNQIFISLTNIVDTENKKSNSITNKITLGSILLLSSLNTSKILILIFFQIVNSENSNFCEKQYCGIFSIAYLFGFLIYFYGRKSFFRLSENILTLNLIILFIFILAICLCVFFYIFEEIIDNTKCYYTFLLYINLSLFLFVNTIIEMLSIKIMIKLIPIEKKICSLNIDNFLDIFESFTQSLIFIGLFFGMNYFEEYLKGKYLYKGIILTCYVFGVLVFICDILKMKKNALVKIMNKTTFEF